MLLQGLILTQHRDYAQAMRLGLSGYRRRANPGRCRTGFPAGDAVGAPAIRPDPPRCHARCDGWPAVVIAPEAAGARDQIHHRQRLRPDERVARASVSKWRRFRPGTTAHRRGTPDRHGSDPGTDGAKSRESIDARYAGRVPSWPSPTLCRRAVFRVIPFCFW